VTNYYVYYRVDLSRVNELRAAVEELFRAVERETGIRGRWMRRCDDPSTYMEVYEGVPAEAAFEALLERAASKMGLTRKLERFECA
jgi:hypothetical protein